MLKNVTYQETDTFDEVNVVLNKLIDNLNLVENKVLFLDANSKKSAGKPIKKRKGFLAKTVLMVVICLMLCSTVFGEFQQITFNNVTNDNTLVTILRERLSFAGGTFTFSNGLTIDNATNNAFEWNENDEELIWTFATDAVNLSSGTGVVSMDFVTIVPTANQMLFTPVTAIVGTTEGTVYYDSDTDKLFLRNASTLVDLTAGAGTTPAGSDTQMQYNNGGAFGAITTIIWDDTNLEFANDQSAAFGTEADWTVNFDDSEDDQLIWLSAATTAGAITDPLYEIIVGTSPTAGQQVFGVAKGTQVTNTALFTVDDDGDGVFAGTLDVTGALTVGSFIGDITLSSAETITNTTDSEINFAEDGGEDFIFDMDASSNAIGLKSTTGVVELAMGAVDDLSGVGTIAFDAEDSSISLASDGTDDLTISVTGAQDTRLLIQSSGTQEDAIALSTSAGGMTLTVTGAAGAEDLTLASNTAVNITSSQATDLAINIATSNASGQIQITSADTTADGIEIDSAGGIDAVAAAGPIVLTATGASTGDYTVTVGDEYILNVTGGIDIDSDEVGADSILLNASNAAGGVDINYGTGAMTLTGTGTAANLTIDVDALSFDFTDSSNITVTSSEAGEDLTISQIGGNDSSIIITSAGQGVNAIELTTSDAVGDIDINAGDAITIDAGDIVITTDDAVASQFHVDATGVVAGNAIILETTNGGLQIDVDGVANGDIDIDADDAMTIDVNHVVITLTNPAADQFKVDATGIVAGFAIVFKTTDGGIQLNADGGTNGDITIDAASVLDLIAAGGITTSDAFTGDGTATLGGFLRTITNDTEPHAVAITESGTVLTNLGANGADTWQLPNAVAGLEYIFVVMAAQEMQITPQGADNINSGGTALGAGDYYVADAVGEMLHIIAVDTTNWIVISETGTWTDQNP